MSERETTPEPKEPDYWDAIDKKLAERRIIMLHGEVEEGMSGDTARELMYLSAISRDPIHVILNSVGGDVFDGLLLFDTIRLLVNEGVEVTVEARGLAASMATIILQAATSGKRVASKYTRILIHEVSSMSAGRTSEQEDQVKELKKLNDMLRDILAERTGKPAAEIERLWHKTDYWMSTAEALEQKFIDQVI